MPHDLLTENSLLNSDAYPSLASNLSSALRMSTVSISPTGLGNDPYLLEDSIFTVVTMPSSLPFFPFEVAIVEESLEVTRIRV